MCSQHRNRTHNSCSCISVCVCVTTVYDPGTGRPRAWAIKEPPDRILSNTIPLFSIYITLQIYSHTVKQRKIWLHSKQYGLSRNQALWQNVNMHWPLKPILYQYWSRHCKNWTQVNATATTRGNTLLAVESYEPGCPHRREISSIEKSLNQQGQKRYVPVSEEKSPV